MIKGLGNVKVRVSILKKDDFIETSVKRYF